MKIVDLQTFLSLPGNVLYQKYTPETMWLERLSIRRERCNENDWFQSVVCDPQMIDATNAHSCQCLSEVLANLKGVERFQNFSVDFAISGREATYEDDALFAVYEAEDVTDLIEELKRCLPS